MALTAVRSITLTLNSSMTWNQTGDLRFHLYVFVPKSEQEATQVNDIIMEFKKWSAGLNPKKGMFEVPHVFSVSST